MCAPIRAGSTGGRRASAVRSTSAGRLSSRAAGRPTLASPHLGGSHFVKVAGIDMVHVPYRGNGPMIQALLADDVQIVFDTPTLVLPQIHDGKLIALGVTREDRM